MWGSTHIHTAVATATVAVPVPGTSRPGKASEHECEPGEGWWMQTQIPTKRGGAVHGNQEAGEREGWWMQNNSSNCGSSSRDNNKWVQGYKLAWGECKGYEWVQGETNEHKAYKATLSQNSRCWSNVSAEWEVLVPQPNKTKSSLQVLTVAKGKDEAHDGWILRLDYWFVFHICVFLISHWCLVQEIFLFGY